MLPRRLLDWKSAATFVVADPDWRRKVSIGRFLMLIPPLGWPAALGYRKTLISRLNERSEPALPEWKGQVATQWWQGMKAIGVMTGYPSPIISWTALPRCLEVGGRQSRLKQRSVDDCLATFCRGGSCRYSDNG